MLLNERIFIYFILQPLKILYWIEKSQRVLFMLYIRIILSKIYNLGGFSVHTMNLFSAL